MRSSVSRRCRSSTPRTGSPRKFDDQIAGPQRRFGRGRAFRHRGDRDAAIVRELMHANETARDRRVLSGDAQMTAADAAIAQQRRHDVARRVDRHRERDALAAENHRGVDADDLRAARDERPARVAGIERGIGLDQVLHQPHGARAQRAAERADDAGRDRVLKTKRIADRDDELTGSQCRTNRRTAPRSRSGAETRRTARSVCGSSPTRSATRSRPSGNVTPMRVARLAAPKRPGREGGATTWLLVRMRPSGAKMNPDPVPPASTFTTDGPTRSTAVITACEYASIDSDESRSRDSSSLRTGRSDLDDAKSNPSLNRFGSGRHAQLAKDRRQVELHRVLADRQLVRDLAIGQAVRDERQHIMLARRQRFDQPAFALRASARQAQTEGNETTASASSARSTSSRFGSAVSLRRSASSASDARPLRNTRRGTILWFLDARRRSRLHRRRWCRESP